MTIIEREASVLVRRLAAGFPVVGITGPRQSGKTTLARAAFPGHAYCSLEDPDRLDFARADPRAFLAQFSGGAILDEVQRCPQLFSYLQGVVDNQTHMGRWVLTGSQQFGFRQHATQTLAGRIGFATLLPLSMRELGARVNDLNNLMRTGGYPALYSREVASNDWYSSYVQTYVERDVHQLLNVKDLATFRTFLRLCAGRAGQLINLSDLGNDAGISHNTAKEWLSVLEASFIIVRLSPHHRNFSKRLIKTPKLYFIDTGVLCWLLGIRTDDQLAIHSMRGQIFENFVLTELMKTQLGRGENPSLYFWRDSSQLEVDILIDVADRLVPVEIKSGATLTSDQYAGLQRWMALAGTSTGYLVYAGDQPQQRGAIRAVPWRDVPDLALNVT